MRLPARRVGRGGQRAPEYGTRRSGSRLAGRVARRQGHVNRGEVHQERPTMARGAAPRRTGPPPSTISVSTLTSSSAVRHRGSVARMCPPFRWSSPAPHEPEIALRCPLGSLYPPAMGMKNYLIEGLSGTGKTSVCNELQRRGYHAIHGDRELAYRGDPETGEPTDGVAHEYHMWHVDKVKALIADQDEPATFFCGGSRNLSNFIGQFDGVFVLEVDLATLNRRLDERPDEEWGGGKPTERKLIARWHETKEGVPRNGISIDATAPIGHVVDDILRRIDANKQPERRKGRGDLATDTGRTGVAQVPAASRTSSLGGGS